MPSSPEEFISAEIEVDRNETNGNPVSFRWNNKRSSVKEIIAAWQDWGFSGGAPKKKTWRMRRHRNYFRVETDSGEVFEIYHDRGIKPGETKWILSVKCK